MIPHTEPHLGSAATRRVLEKYVSRRVPACDVDDVVQATLCDALASGRLPGADPDRVRWLLGIARYKVVDALRAASRSSALPPGEIAVHGAPFEERSLARWAERKLPPGEGAEKTLRWLWREAEGDKLEAIAADEHLPADRVRQRVSRLRRWMREQWQAELCAVAILAIWVGMAIQSPAPVSELILPETAGTSEAAAAQSPLHGVWKLDSFTPAAPLPAVRKGLFDRVAPSFQVAFDGHAARGIAAQGTFERSYAAAVARPGWIAVDDGRGRQIEIAYAWEGEVLVLKIPSGPWAGVARFRAMGR